MTRNKSRHFRVRFMRIPVPGFRRPPGPRMERCKRHVEQFVGHDKFAFQAPVAGPWPGSNRPGAIRHFEIITDYLPAAAAGAVDARLVSYLYSVQAGSPSANYRETAEPSAANGWNAGFQGRDRRRGGFGNRAGAGLVCSDAASAVDAAATGREGRLHYRNPVRADFSRRSGHLYSAGGAPGAAPKSQPGIP